MSNGSGGGGCAKVIGIILLIGIIITVLQAIWPVLFVLAVAFFVAALVIRRKDAEKTSAESSSAGDMKGKEEYRTEKCPNCGAQVKIPVSKDQAKCEYCRTVVQSSKPAKKTGGKKAQPAKQQLSSFAICCIIAAICAVCGLVGYAYSQSSASQSDTSASTDSTESESTTDSESASSASTSSNPSPAATTSGSNETDAGTDGSDSSSDSAGGSDASAEK